MKEIQLTQGKVAIVDDEDYEYLNRWKWFAHKRNNAFYATRKYLNKQVSMHRQIMNAGDISILVDHKDRNSLNNTKQNLRLCNRSQNNANTKPRKGSLSKYIGVSLFKKTKNSKGKWRATIGKDKRIFHLGYFKTQEDAALAYNVKAQELHGEFASLNQIQ